MQALEQGTKVPGASCRDASISLHRHGCRYYVLVVCSRVRIKIPFMPL